MNKQKTLIFSLSAMLFLTASFLVYSWSEPTATMPGTYVSPVNTSGTAQTKSGDLSATSFIDANNPSYYLNPSGSSVVSGTITADRPTETNNLTTKGYVDEKIAEVAGIVTGAQPLVNGAHSQSDCTNAEGEVVDSDVSYKICRFDASTCPDGWNKYKNYNTAIATTYSCARYEVISSVGEWSTSCVTSTKSWSNETYSCVSGYRGIDTNTFGTTCCSCAVGCSTCVTTYYAYPSSITQIGCY